MSSFRDELIGFGLMLPSGVDGLYGTAGSFEATLAGIDRLITRLGAPFEAEVLRFPPGMNPAQFIRSGYLQSFPKRASIASAATSATTVPCYAVFTPGTPGSPASARPTSC